MIYIFKKKKIIHIDNSTLSDGWDSVIAKDVYINFTCSKCGYSENVPDWIVGELNPFSRKPSLACPKCDKAMYRTKETSK